jgi:Protein of unknown function (DUF4235)
MTGRTPPYKPISLLISVLGGVLASMLFTRVWKAITGQDEKPSPTDYHRGWGEVLAAAVMQGAVYGFVKALLDRAGAHGYARATGEWPGAGGPPATEDTS